MEWKKFLALFALQFNSLSVINSHWGYGFQRHTFKYHESKFALTIDKIFCAEYISGCRYVFIFIYPDGYMHVYMPRVLFCTVYTSHCLCSQNQNQNQNQSQEHGVYVFVVCSQSSNQMYSSAWQIRSDVFSLSESWSCFQQVAK